MKMTSKNLGGIKITAKTQTAKKVFRTIMKYGPLERKQIQERSRLSWGAVSNMTGILINAGLVIQNSNPNGNVGKVPAILDINPDDNYLVGIDLTTTYVRCVLFNLKGEAIASQMGAILNPADVVVQLLSLTEELLAPYLGKKNILSISVSTPGTVDTENGVLLQLATMPVWENLYLARELEDHFHIPSYLFWDADCMMIAEKYFGSIVTEHYQNVVALDMNSGISMSTLIHSRIYTSLGHSSGEIGHITAVPDGTLCKCGKRGCLEMYASRFGVVSQYAEEIGRLRQTDVSDTIANVDTSYDTIRHLAESGDELSLHVFHQAGVLLGRALANLSSMLDPEVIILYGNFIADRHLYQEVLEKTFHAEKYVLSKTRLLYSELTGTSSALGAAYYSLELLLEALLSDAISGAQPRETPEH